MKNENPHYNNELVCYQYLSYNMSNIMPFIMSSPPPIDDNEEDEDDEFGDFRMAEHSFALNGKL